MSPVSDLRRLCLQSDPSAADYAIRLAEAIRVACSCKPLQGQLNPQRLTRFSYEVHDSVAPLLRWQLVSLNALVAFVLTCFLATPENSSCFYYHGFIGDGIVADRALADLCLAYSIPLSRIRSPEN